MIVMEENVKQRLVGAEMIRYELEDCIIMVSNDKKTVKAWTARGSAAWYIRPTEYDIYRFDPKRALAMMRHKVLANIGRCSRCGWEGPKEEFKYGHMAAILCVACIEDDKKDVETDIKTGNVCRICKKPRHLCNC